MGAPHITNPRGSLYCPVCRETKDEVTEFHHGASLKQGTPCRECANERTREWRRQNPERVREHHDKAWRKRAKRNYEFVRGYKSERGCSVCGEGDPICLDFHHLDPSAKLFNIGNQTQHTSIKRLLSEMVKCVVICRNCHAKLHLGGE